MSPLEVALAGLGAALALMTAVWAASVAKRDVSIVDIFWGPGFALAAWTYRALDPAPTARSLVVPALVTLWAVRLGAHIWWRSRGQGEDRRYRAIRERWEPGFAWKSLGIVFWLQAALLWIVSAPLLAAVTSSRPPGWTWLDTLGTALFAAGFLFEAVGDLQLARFKSDPDHRGEVFDRGLWRYTRHPNYFGDALLWWGFAAFGLATGAWWTVVGPALMTFLLMRVSGVTLLEKDLSDRKPGYREYVEKTSAFFPRPPKE